MSGYGSMPAQQQRTPIAGTSNGLAVAGLVCGIVGLLLFNVILGPLAIIFGGVGLSRASQGAGHRTMAIWSVALGVLDLVIFGLLLVAASRHGGTLYFHVG